MILTTKTISGFMHLDNGQRGCLGGRYIAEVHIPRGSFLMRAEFVHGRKTNSYYRTNQVHVERICNSNRSQLNDGGEIKWLLLGNNIHEGGITTTDNLNFYVFFKTSDYDPLISFHPQISIF